MKVLSAKTRNLPEFDNLPSLELLVDSFPENLIYTEKNNHYYAEKDGYVNFYYYSTPGDGYGGRVFKVQMEDGSVKDLRGPWSSNSQSVFNAGFPMTVAVSITDDPKAFERGYTFFACHVTLEKFIEACEVAKCSYAQDKNGLIYPMPFCEDCKFPYTQKYRTLVDVGGKYPKNVRKILCNKCVKNYNLETKAISSEVVYDINPVKNVINKECSDEQVSIL